jgi:hypothetical protein
VCLIVASAILAMIEVKELCCIAVVGVIKLATISSTVLEVSLRACLALRNHH